MYAFGDLDDAVSVVDVWLHDHPELPPWERDEYTTPVTYATYRKPLPNPGYPTDWDDREEQV